MRFRIPRDTLDWAAPSGDTGKVDDDWLATFNDEPLHALVAEALDSLGDGYVNAQEAVCQETALFIHRLPALIDLNFSDGTPFADSETRQWLNNISLEAGSV